MKTIMQELIDKIQLLKELDGVINPIAVITIIAEQLIEKEKDQLYHSFYAGGGVTALQDFKEEFDKYYNEVYKCE